MRGIKWAHNIGVLVSDVVVAVAANVASFTDIIVVF
jgi:hypothetical protein